MPVPLHFGVARRGITNLFFNSDPLFSSSGNRAVSWITGNAHFNLVYIALFGNMAAFYRCFIMWPKLYDTHLLVIYSSLVKHGKFFFMFEMNVHTSVCIDWDEIKLIIISNECCNNLVLVHVFCK